ncbi:MAG TPA: NYN domain-containing protein [bacterium]|jgi:uncharacterized LabA/DUF88 family protein|nr:NYN domain-containing protein [bacterium]HOX85142.1 NYN domain-containing protein [bacterium]HPG47065.1 NYN domain-containing protein [bacterium]HPM99347.1 NYN domain-containing protein [bacterium]
MNRVIVYIDGFNLYFGLKSKNWKRFYWLNLQKLAQNLLSADQVLIRTKYFTSRISLPPDKAKRQSIFIDALMTLTDFDIFYGHYQANTITCYRCQNIISKPNEKMTDVNIAVEMLCDTFGDCYDTAILVSGDSDLLGPIQKIRSLFPQKRIVLAFPPDRFSFALKTAASAYFMIGRKKFADSLFPDQVVDNSGFVLTKPVEWL